MILPNEDEMKDIKGTSWNKPATSWDPVMGYRWNNEENRMFRVSRGEIVADNTYKFNNYYQHSSYDYSPAKKADNIYRFIVLGDSFTNDIMLSAAWPETLQNLLASRKEFRNDFEVFSFPTDGGGLVNWHATFTELIDKEFEYDALIIADWGDDLERNWVVSDCTDEGFRWASVEPKDRPRSAEEFEALLPELKNLYSIKSNEEIEDLAQALKKNAAPKAMNPAEYLSERAGAELPPDCYDFSRDVFVERYGEMRYSMLKEIIDICQARKKSVIYSTLPTRQGLIHLQNDGKKLLAQVQGDGLCKHFGIHFFDGFDAFRDIDSQSLIDFYWLKYDGHWNLGASMHYALKLANWIFQTKLFLRVLP